MQFAFAILQLGELVFYLIKPKVEGKSRLPPSAVFLGASCFWPEAIIYARIDRQDKMQNISIESRGQSFFL